MLATSEGHLTNAIYPHQSLLGDHTEKEHLVEVTPPSHNNPGLQWCSTEKPTPHKAVDLNNTSLNHYYRNLLIEGGYYIPLGCVSRHKVAIIVPFRDRQFHLHSFLNVMHPFLIDQKLAYRIFVIEQNGKGLFNRGGLLNVGFLEAKKYSNWDCMVFHDVDLLPINKEIPYSCPNWPRHMCSTVVKGNKISKAHTFFGGVSSMTVNHFQKVNGFSNMYWGWGGEDSDIFLRLRAVGIPIVRYNKAIGKYLSLSHVQNTANPNRHDLLKTAVDRYLTDGLSSLNYKVISATNRLLYTHIKVEIGF
ncbi:hypothetical protein ACJJTC_002526 [Scirpophaga incertulas]